MKNTIKRGTWFIFLLLGWIILVINGNRGKKIHLNFIKELKHLCNRNSVYIPEDGDYIIVHKKDLK